MNLKKGQLLKRGEYRVEKELGQGGFGITYLAEQTGLMRKVAIKEFFMREYCEREHETASITLGSSGSREMVERFRQKFIKEARALAVLNHKHIVRIIDIFEENNTAYYVMEYVDGGSLSYKVKSGALPEADALRYICQVATALNFVHGKRMMHLDVKPSNILLNENDEAVLIDFGLAKQYDTQGSQTSTTPVGISHGYAPLEQYRQGGVGTFSPATDIYSLGATLYKLLTGETPPEAGDVMNEGLPELPVGISSNARKAIETAMQPAVRKRPQSVGEFLALLEGNVKAESGKVKTESNDDGATEILHSVQDDKYREKNSSTNLGEVPQAEGYNPNRASVISNESEKSPENGENEILRSTQNDKECAASTDDGETVVANAENSELDKEVDIKTKDTDNLNNNVQVDDTEHCGDKTLKRRKNAVFAEILFAAFFIFLIFFGIKLCNGSMSSDPDARSHGTINGHEYVDLGLSVKWATCNVGASNPEDYGGYYAWGETEEKSDYFWRTYKWCNGSSNTMTKYCTNSSYGTIDNKTVLDPKDDVAHVKWGGTWRMPTKAEQDELRKNCTWTWTTQNGVEGYKVTSKKNGNSIFLPAAGYRDGLYDLGNCGNYWSSSLGGSDSYFAYYLYFNRGEYIRNCDNRYSGLSVRPVCE